MKMMLSDAQRTMLQTKGIVVARVLVGLLFVVGGINMLMAPAGTAGYFTSIGVPMAGIVVWLVIAVKILGGAAIIIGKRVGIAAAALIIFTILATLLGHYPNLAEDPNEMTQILKNLSIIGGLIYVMAYGAGSMESKSAAAPVKSM
jgi:putative oxidoreductase